MKNNKGQFEIFWVFVIFATVLVVGIVASLLIGVANFTSKTITPVVEDLGMIDSYNVSEAGSLTFGTLNSLIGMLPMIVGFTYLMLLVGCIILVVMYRGTANMLFIGLFFALMLLMLLVAVLGSNFYQDFYDGDDELALELQSQTMLSFLILNSPYIFAVVGFICGIFLFSGRQNENYGYGGAG